MSADHDLILEISAPGIPREVVSRVQEQFVRELNERAPIADALTQEQPGRKGLLELVGHVGLALLTPDLVGYIGRVIVEFVKRNDRYSITVGDIVISKDNASAQDMDRIEQQLLKVMAKRKGKKRR